MAQLTSMAIVLPDADARLTGHGNLNVDQLVVGVQVLQGALLPLPIQGGSPLCSVRRPSAFLVRSLQTSMYQFCALEALQRCTTHVGRTFPCLVIQETPAGNVCIGDGAVGSLGG